MESALVSLASNFVQNVGEAHAAKVGSGCEAEKYVSVAAVAYLSHENKISSFHNHPLQYLAALYPTWPCDANKTFCFSMG